ncbi:DUF3100 family protein [Scopulibacillus darangshiensis]|uniref:DUF3100 family protein n=1 Tax=Scopulibacillus darangshiensis TaxID=442528 RepID=A0A4R2P983_9BACL|nr:DUF3100 domain-containing protein [Scopulibacillus darangshiensis]TCP30898.1 DUF3100 family protein [Scopulibacillus darangshiensis]
MNNILKNAKIHFLVLIIVIISEIIGTKTLNVGIGVIALFPMLYAMVLGGIISLPSIKFLNTKEMNKAAHFLGICFMLFVIKVATAIGPSLPKIFDVGIPLLIQEAGHVLGTIIIGLPVALLIGMKREAIGATYSIDREPNLAIIAEKYGADSPEGRGALGVYICGTVFGAIYVAFLASIIGGWGIFHPISLAMAAGVGSNSMMAAATGALSVIYPDLKDDLIVYAGAANLMAGAIGIYVCIFFSLPFTARMYTWLEPLLGRKKAAVKKEETGL